MVTEDVILKYEPGVPSRDALVILVERIKVPARARRRIAGSALATWRTRRRYSLATACAILPRKVSNPRLRCVRQFQIQEKEMRLMSGSSPTAKAPTRSQRLLNTEVFDAEYYAAECGRDFESKQIAARHFVQYGMKSGLSFHRWSKWHRP